MLTKIEVLCVMYIRKVLLMSNIARKNALIQNDEQ